MASDLTTLASEVLDKAKARNLRITTAESCTGGLVAGALTEIPGSSAAVDCGFVTYSNAAKHRLLDVQDSILAAHGAVSEEVATEMALGAVANSEAELSVSITGIAGPGGSEHKPEGRVCFAVALQDHILSVQTHEFGAIGRTHVRHASVICALRMLSAALDGIRP